jgi:hypothetical protein
MPDYEAEVVSVDTGETVETKAEPQPEEKVETEVKTEETTETKKEETNKETPTDDNLVELPDGRKLPPKEAEKEYRTLYSEFTRKSQKLATYEKDPSKITNNETEKKGEWIPETWEEVLEKSKQALREDLEKEQKLEKEQREQNEKNVLAQLAEIKKENPTLNETQLFNHALKYNFRDLKVAHANMKDMLSSIKKASETTAQNITKRNAEQINTGVNGGDIPDGDVYDPSVRNMSMLDYLRSMK